MVNSYMCYKRYSELKRVPVQWTRHDWNQAIGYAHLDPDEDWQRKKKSPEKIPAAAKSTSSEENRASRLVSKLSLQPEVG